jgi:hypothetical protein
MFRALQPSEAPGSGGVLASRAPAKEGCRLGGVARRAGSGCASASTATSPSTGPTARSPVYASRAVNDGWSTIPSYHERLWREALAVERRDLAVCEEAARWN